VQPLDLPYQYRASLERAVLRQAGKAIKYLTLPASRPVAGIEIRAQPLLSPAFLDMLNNGSRHGSGGTGGGADLRLGIKEIQRRYSHDG
jgi:hypothetical protein